jgi:hypothetical protein
MCTRGAEVRRSLSRGNACVKVALHTLREASGQSPARELPQVYT